MSKKTTVLNCPIDIVSVEEAINDAKCAIDKGHNFQIVTINPEMIMQAQVNKSFFQILKNSNLNIVDGVGVKIALKLQNLSAHRVRGIDFARALIELANKENLSIGLLGAKEEIIQKVYENIKNVYPNLNISYVRNGYFENDDEIIKEISEKNPKIILVGLGSPKQEEIIDKLKKVLNSSIMIGVGGSFDVFSGDVKESPYILRRMGLEWLYRTMSQPERFKRIFPTLPIFILKCIIDSIRKGMQN